MGTAPIDRCKVPPAFWRAIARVGLPPASVLRQARLPGTLHLDAQGLVTTAQYFALWRALEALSPAPGLAVNLIAATDISAYPPSALIAFYARDYRDGLARTARFKRLCTPEQLHIAEAQGECAIVVEWLYATEPAPAVATDVTFATLLELGRRGTGQHLAPARVELARPRPRGVDPLKDYFGCAIRYGAPQDKLVLKSADLDRPFPSHNPELLALLTPALADALGEIDASGSIGDQVRGVLKRSLAAGRPELADVARDLGMSERTLQRRITDEGSTFRDLLVQARQELGRTLLADPAADIGEVACLLGYQDASSFYRAFREWEGTTPHRWRAKNVRGGFAIDLGNA